VRHSPLAPTRRYDAKVQVVFDHVRSAYGDDGASVYEEAEVSIEEGNLPARRRSMRSPNQ